MLLCLQQLFIGIGLIDKDKYNLYIYISYKLY